MTFPTIPTAAAGRIISAKQADTNATRSFPDLGGLTKNPGDRIVLIAVSYGTNTSTNNWSSWPTGFTEVADIGNSSVMTFGVAEKISDGTETGVVTVHENNTVSGQCDLIVLSIPGTHPTQATENTSGATGTTSAANPAALTPSWGQEDTLWLEVIGNGASATTGTFDGIAAAAANYANLYTVGPSATPSNVVGVVDLGVAFRQLNASSEDVGQATVDVSSARNSAFVLAIRTGNPATITADASSDGSGTATQSLPATIAADARSDAIANGSQGVVTSGTATGDASSDATATATQSLPATAAADAGSDATATATQSLPATAAADAGSDSTATAGQSLPATATAGASSDATATATEGGGGGGGGSTITFADGTTLTLVGFADGTPLTVRGLADGTPLA